MRNIPPEIVAFANGAAAFVAALVLGWLAEAVLTVFGFKVDLSASIPALTVVLANIALALFVGFLSKLPQSYVPILLQILVTFLGVWAAYAHQQQRLELKRYRALAAAAKRP